MIPTVSEALAAVEAVVPCATLVWPDGQAPPLPYAVLVPHESRDEYADCATLARARAYDVELYTREYDVELVRRLSAALDAANVVFSSDVTGDEQNRFVLTYFSTTLRE